MKVEGSLGALLQGVNQQPARIRLEGQVTEQINYMSDISTGLTSRPASDQLFEFTGVSEETKFHAFQLNQVDYVIAYGNTMRIWDVSGKEYTVNYEDADVQNYIGPNMQFHVFNDDSEDILYCNNSDVVVRAQDNVDGYPFRVALVTALGGQFSRTYSVEVVIDGQTYAASYQTPDGTGNNDGEDTRSENIIEQLTSQLVSLNIPDALVVRQDDVLQVRVSSDADISVTVSDGDNGTILRSMAETIEDTADLPQFAPHGTIVRVIGDTSLSLIHI